MSVTAQNVGLLAERALGSFEGPTRESRTLFDVGETGFTNPALISSEGILRPRKEFEWREITDETVTKPASLILRASGPAQEARGGGRYALLVSGPLTECLNEPLLSGGAFERSSAVVRPTIQTAKAPRYFHGVVPVDAFSGHGIIATEGGGGVIDIDSQWSAKWMPSTAHELSKFFEALWKESRRASLAEAGEIDASNLFDETVRPTGEFDWGLYDDEGDSIGAALGEATYDVASDNPIVAQISSARDSADVEEDCESIANDAAKDAVTMVARNKLGSVPFISFSDDGILSLQWERNNSGVGLIFAGDGTASIVFRRPGQFYAENGIEVAVNDDLPQSFNDALADILR